MQALFPDLQGETKQTRFEKCVMEMCDGEKVRCNKARKQGEEPTENVKNKVFWELDSGSRSTMEIFRKGCDKEPGKVTLKPLWVEMES